MSYNSKLPADTTVPAEIRENLRALKEDKIVAAATAVVADSAAKLTTARKISLEGDATGSTSFDGSADVSIQEDVLSADNANTIEGRNVNDIISACSIYAVPAGAVEYFARQTAPTGWIKADGSVVSRTQYADLFAAVGTVFGTGDGSTTFNLPDLRGEFIRGYDDGRGIDFIGMTGNIVSGSNQITNLLGLNTGDPTVSSYLTVGMPINCNGIPEGTTIVAIDNNTTITLSANAAISANRASMKFMRSLGSAQNGSQMRGTASNTGKNGIANMWGNSSFDAIDTIKNFYPSSSSMDSIDVIKGVVRPRNVALLACIKY